MRNENSIMVRAVVIIGQCFAFARRPPIHEAVSGFASCDCVNPCLP